MRLVVIYTGKSEDKVTGMAFDISSQELEQADDYEVADYKRIHVTLESGLSAWVYVHASQGIFAEGDNA